MDMAKPTVVYTCCGGSGGWSILRSLAPLGKYRLIGADSDGLAAGLYAPELDGHRTVPAGDDPAYVAAVVRLCDEEGADLFWPGSDEEILAVARRHDDFAQVGTAVMTSPAATVEAVTDKLATVRKLAELGVLVPRSWRLDEAPDDPSIPVIVRPRVARSGKGVRFFDDHGETAKFADELGPEVERYFVQELIDCRTGRLHMAQAIFDRAQNLKAFFSSRSIRTTYSWGGPALGGVPVVSSRLKELTLKIFEATGPYFGPVNAEFILDPDRGDFVFVEINPRYWGYSYLATAAGINFPELTVRLALGQDITPDFEYRTDIVTMTSREQIAVPRDSVLGEIPGGGRTVAVLP